MRLPGATPRCGNAIFGFLGSFIFLMQSFDSSYRSQRAEFSAFRWIEVLIIESRTPLNTVYSDEIRFTTTDRRYLGFTRREGPYGRSSMKLFNSFASVAWVLMPKWGPKPELSYAYMQWADRIQYPE